MKIQAMPFTNEGKGIAADVSDNYDRHLYLRVIRERTHEMYSETEKQSLYTCFSSAPGVQAVKDIQPHPRGGYSSTLEYTGGATDAIVSHMELYGYKGVI